MLSILLLSKNGELYGIAEKLSNGKTIVKYYPGGGEVYRTGREKFSIVGGWKSLLPAADLVIHSPGYGRELKELDDGGRLFGGGVLSDWLTDSAESYPKLKILYKRAEGSGVDVNVGALITKDGIIGEYLGLIARRFLEGERGQEVDGMGCLVVDISGSKLGKAVFSPLESLLKSFNYRGFLEVRCEVSKGGVTPLSFTPLPKSGTYQAIFDGLGDRLGEYIYTAVSGGIRCNKGLRFSCSVGLSVPPWPYGGVALDLSLDDQVSKHFWASGKVGFLGFATARGRDIREARRRVYRTVRNVAKVPEVQFRRDVGLDLTNLEKLAEWGWIDACISDTDRPSYRGEDGSESNGLPGASSTVGCAQGSSADVGASSG